jgi:hypothetical protein
MHSNQLIFYNFCRAWQMIIPIDPSYPIISLITFPLVSVNLKGRPWKG